MLQKSLVKSLKWSEKMTVKELSDVSEQKFSNSNVCSSAKSNMYVVCGVVMKLGGVVTIQGYSWVSVNNGVAIIGR